MLIAARVGSATTSRHFLRRYVTPCQRIDAQEIKVRHIPESQNPSDFLTKWVLGKKLRESLEFGTNSRARTAAAQRSAAVSHCFSRHDCMHLTHACGEPVIGQYFVVATAFPTLLSLSLIHI